MNNVLESTYALAGSFIGALNTLICDVSNLVLTSFSSDSGESDTSSGNGGSSSSANSGEKVALNLPQVLHEAASLFAFDDFQFLLLKIFLIILVSNVCLIYIAWHVYGERITERFMSPNTSPEELKQSVLDLKLPTEHSQRHS